MGFIRVIVHASRHVAWYVNYQCGGNAREAAERLTMHKNTDHYRLARVEELRGRPVGERRLEFEVALMLAHVFGDRVLPDQSPPTRP